MEQLHVRLERDGDIAVIVIDNPPINAGSAAVREGLMAAIAIVKSDESLHGAVLIGAGNTFIAGSDLREFGQPLAEPQLPAVIRAIEDCGKPVAHGGGRLATNASNPARASSPLRTRLMACAVNSCTSPVTGPTCNCPNSCLMLRCACGPACSNSLTQRWTASSRSASSRMMNEA